MLLKIIFSTVLITQLPFVLTETDDNLPVVITTWSFVHSAFKAWHILKDNGTALDAVEQGCTVCEKRQCDTTVGYGGSPDENGETTLDAMIMDGKTMKVGAVAALRRVKPAMSVARHILDHTKHSMLAGDLATQFAVQMGFKEETLSTNKSKQTWLEWRNKKNCQPNFWMGVTPDPQTSCGPYKPIDHTQHEEGYSNIRINQHNHDTIGMIAIDKKGYIAAGTSTNGAKYKIPGRVGDSPIPGAGAYADDEVGGAAATGDGDVMLRFLPSFLAVEEMRRGAAPKDAAETAIRRITRHYPDFMGAVIALNKDGSYGAACHGITLFPFVVKNGIDKQFLKTIECENPRQPPQVIVS